MTSCNRNIRLTGRGFLLGGKTLLVYFLFATFFALTGCVNYLGINSNKKITRPSQLQTSKSLPDRKGHWPTHHWASQFGDPQLVALINEAIANNPTLEAARARVVQARALVDSRGADLWPTIGWEGRVIRGRLSANLVPPIVGGGQWFTFSEFLFKLNWEIDFWGKNLATLRQAISIEKADEAAAHEAQLIIATSVASTYNQLAHYYALRQIFKRTVIQRESLDKISMVRLRTGLDTNVQVYQSRNTTATARTQLLDVEGQIILTRQQLGTLLGKGPDRGLKIAKPSLSIIRTPALPSNLPLCLLGRRPDIVGARWRVEASCQGIKNAQAQFYPNVNLSALAGFLSIEFHRLFENASRQYQMGPAITLPIFDAGALRAQLRERYGEYEEAVANYNNTLNNAFSDVATQLTTIKSIDKQLVTQREALSAAERAYNLARYQYRIGLTSQLVVLDAETRYLTEQQSRLQLITNRRNLQIALIKALDGGFDARMLITKCCRAPKKKCCHPPTK